MREDKHVGVIGASSPVGRCLLPLLIQAGWQVTAFSRIERPISAQAGVQWRRTGDWPVPALHHWICVAPIWVLSEYLEVLTHQGARRVIALSSTSRFTKGHSSDLREQHVVQQLVQGESNLETWAAVQQAEYAILRPTLIYGFGQDKNISEIIRFIQRFGFFPLFGKAKGLRQPIHAEDVAKACLSALQAAAPLGRSYNISGGETLSYRDMVARTFHTLGRSPRMITIPLRLFKCGIACLQRVPRYRHWSSAMAERMNQDLVFDHEAAQRELNFYPRPFRLSKEDLPKC